MHGNNTGHELQYSSSRDPYALLKDSDAQLSRSKGAMYIWSTSQRFFGCVMPKTGSTSWLHYIRSMLLPAQILTEIKRSRHIYKPVSYDQYGLHFRKPSLKELQLSESIINDLSYFKWVVVRHPWRRLVSSFRSKYEGECKGSRHCLRETFKVPLRHTIENTVTFHEFVEALASVDPIALDKHFRPAYLLCELDRIPYNFIGDLHVARDMDYISARMGFSKNFSSVATPLAAKAFGEAYYSGRTHAVHNCTAATVHIAAHLYRHDARYLGCDFAEAMASCSTHGLSAPPRP
jgi:hypothetical protein